MKLGVFLLVFGLLLAGIGIAAWQYAQSAVGGAYREGIFGSPPELYTWPLLFGAGGLGLTIFGGGLAVGGIVRMIVKRSVTMLFFKLCA